MECLADALVLGVGNLSREVAKSPSDGQRPSSRATRGI